MITILVAVVMLNSTEPQTDFLDEEEVSFVAGAVVGLAFVATVVVSGFFVRHVIEREQEAERARRAPPIVITLPDRSTRCTACRP